MKRRHRQAELFSLSFLDVLACALGGVLLLLLLSTQQHSEQTAESQQNAIDLQRLAATQASRARRALASAQQARDQIVDMQSTLKAAQKALGQLSQSNQSLVSNNKALALSNQQLTSIQKKTEARIRELEELEAALIGLNGDLNNVVFVFDTSGSMKTEQFDDYQRLLTTWISGVASKQFEVISFDKDVTAWRGRWAATTPAHQQAATDFVHRLTPDGSTNTLAAFQAALDANRYPDVDTVVFFSDGAPTDCTFDDVTTWLRDNHPHVVINTVGMGNYFNKEWGAFLHDIADQHGGVFIGR